MKSMILAAVLVLGVAGSAMAQPITEAQTFNVFGKSNRGAGTYTTATATIPEGAFGISVADTMTDQEASDPANKFNLVVFVSPDGVRWEAIFYAKWEGGTHINKFTGIEEPNHFRPGWSDSRLQSGAMTGWRVRAELDQQTAMRVGFTVTLEIRPLN
jgi:hypothetical protein